MPAGNLEKTERHLSVTRLPQPPHWNNRPVLRRASHAQQQRNLQLIAPSTSENQCGDFDITPDNQRLVCMGDSASPSDTLKMASPLGSTSHIMYHDPVGILQARIISNTTLLFIQTHIPLREKGPDREEALWKINTDGNQPIKLTTSPGLVGYWFDFADCFY